MQVGSAIWEGGCSGLGVLTWALLRLSSSLFAFRTIPSPRSWSFGPVDAVFEAFRCRIGGWWVGFVVVDGGSGRVLGTGRLSSSFGLAGARQPR